MSKQQECKNPNCLTPSCVKRRRDARVALIRSTSKAPIRPRRLRNPEVAKALGRRYAPGWLRKRVLARDGYRCRYCGRSLTDATANMDHIKPWPWGMTELRNLAACCRDCNRDKGTKSRPQRPKNVGRGRRWKGWRYEAPEENGPVVVRREQALIRESDEPKVR